MNESGIGTIEQTTYKGFPAYAMESERVRLVMVPELGGKIVSLLHKPTSKEWLIDSGPRELRRVEYGANFERADVSGWDECFPTIDACAYPLEGAYAGRHMPDHGELWSIPWEAAAENGALVGTASGRALPYAFRRTIRFVGTSALRFEYDVTNTGEEPFVAFWTAHPLFGTTAHTRIELPDDVAELLCVGEGAALERGRTYRWPDGEGALQRPLDEVGPAEARDSRKFYIDGPVGRGVAGLRERDSGDYIALEWPREKLPYFGMWINEGGLIEKTVCALEPCNGFYDSLTEAVARDRVLRLAPGATESWHVDVKLGCEPRS